MNKEQTEELYDRVQINWNLKPLPNARLKELKVWHRYLNQLDYQATSRAIDAKALNGGYPPRPAELYTDVQVQNGLAPPSPQQALIQGKQLIEAVKHGTQLPNTHPLVAETIAQTGVQRDDIFIKLYEEKRRETLADLLGNFDGDNKNQTQHPHDD